MPIPYNPLPDGQGSAGHADKPHASAWGYGGSKLMSALLIKLRPTGPWRIGPDSGDRDRIDRIYHSDSLLFRRDQRHGAASAN